MNLKSMTLPELTAVLKELGQPQFRAKQVYTWLHKGVRAYDEMTNLPKPLRDTLAREYPICAPKVVRRQESARDGTIKYLWELSDGNCVETVLMRYHYGNTVCISTEVGCRMGCAFCASTIGGLVRRLEPYEMLDEVLFTQVDSGLPVSHIVLMGIGEPLDNFDNVMRRGYGEADAAAADGGQHTGQRICRQQEEHAFRRLLHHLQQGVGGFLVHPLHMVEQDGAALGGEAGIENFGAHGLDLTDEIPPARAHAGDGDGLPHHAGLDAAAVAVAGFAHGTAAFAPQKGLSRCAACRVKIVCRHAPGRVARAQARLAHQ